MGSTSEVLACFFSSRRLHTRYWRDWSSDVCSSDLLDSCPNDWYGYWCALVTRGLCAAEAAGEGTRSTLYARVRDGGRGEVSWPPAAAAEIGRASCRGRG